MKTTNEMQGIIRLASKDTTKTEPRTIMKTTKEKRLGIIRVAKEKNYTRVDNRILNDLRLSMAATGLACRLLEKRNDWDINVAYLVNNYQEGEYKIRKIIKELISFGYMQVESLRNEKGQFIGNQYTLYEHPSLNPDYESSEIIETEEIEAIEKPRPLMTEEPETIEEPEKLIFDYALKDYTEQMQQEACKVLQGVPNPQAVLDELNENLSKGTIKNPSGFLISLAQRAKNGNFIATNQLAEKRRKRAEREKWEATQQPEISAEEQAKKKAEGIKAREELKEMNKRMKGIKPTISAEEQEKNTNRIREELRQMQIEKMKSMGMQP
ncbi:hypothetical protein [Beggiatoa leptomitoformis]|uniref:Helix-turn-helix domain-containing protein n=1 Tax=Beggiatoa leptomitoformis TaxID=288004 RepID=A0A2N9YG25_9GAMM|nr:hypothetical protein [Beggiatoa leptomitoformis]ALG68232.1 hypothetical protein AL038_11575 [Beggiatoa leptomitoformis]AUI69462.1 hypothetical protein BLE401_12700 [Beggiatoa leptomitoformis]